MDFFDQIFYYAPEAGQSIELDLSEDLLNHFSQLGEPTEMDLFEIHPNVRRILQQMLSSERVEELPPGQTFVDYNQENVDKEKNLYHVASNKIIAEFIAKLQGEGKTKVTARVEETFDAWLIEDKDSQQTFVLLDDKNGEVKLMIDDFYDPTREDPFVYLPAKYLDLPVFYSHEKDLRILASPQ